MSRSLAVRNALSALLFAVSVVGIVVELRLVHEGHVGPQTRLVLTGYFLVAIYALAAIVVRTRAILRDRR